MGFWFVFVFPERYLCVCLYQKYCGESEVNDGYGKEDVAERMIPLGRKMVRV